jgi:hypothetical protein
MTTKARFEEVARELDVEGRSTMDKAELEDAVLDELDSTDIPVLFPDYGVDIDEARYDQGPFDPAPADDSGLSDEALELQAKTVSTAKGDTAPDKGSDAALETVDEAEAADQARADDDGMPAGETADEAEAATAPESVDDSKPAEDEAADGSDGSQS